MKRHDWAARLFDVIAAHEVRPFEWGDADCCLFAARAVDAMRDTDLEAQLQLRYIDEASAKQMIADAGGLVPAVAEFLGPPVPQRAVRGDVVSIDGGDGEALAICLGSRLVAMGPDGLRYVPRTEIREVWPQ